MKITPKSIVYSIRVEISPKTVVYSITMKIKPKSIVYSIIVKIRLKSIVYSITMQIKPKSIVYSIIIKIRPKFIVYSITIKIRLKSIVCSSGSSRHLSVSRDNGVRLGWSSITLIATAGVAQEPNPGMTVSATVVANEWGRWVGILSLFPPRSFLFHLFVSLV